MGLAENAPDTHTCPRTDWFFVVRFRPLFRCRVLSLYRLALEGPGLFGKSRTAALLYQVPSRFLAELRVGRGSRGPFDRSSLFDCGTSLDSPLVARLPKVTKSRGIGWRVISLLVMDLAPNLADSR